MKDKVEEWLLCILAGAIFAICFIATLCGDGDNGLLDLF